MDTLGGLLGRQHRARAHPPRPGVSPEPPRPVLPGKACAREEPGHAAPTLRRAVPPAIRDRGRDRVLRRDRGAVGRGAGARRGLPPRLARARGGGGTRLARRPRGRGRAADGARARARRVARSGGGGLAPPSRAAAGRRGRVRARRRLARPRGLRRVPRLDRGVAAGRRRDPRGRGERGAADHDAPREGARVGRRLRPRAVEGRDAERAVQREPRGQVVAPAVRAARRRGVPGAGDEGEPRAPEGRGGAAADVRRRHAREAPARAVAGVVLLGHGRRRASRRSSGTKRWTRASCG